MGKTIYMECDSGISGDMTVAALLDLGADQTVLQRALDSIPLKGFHAKISRVKKSGLDCMDFSVVLTKEYENHDDDMEYLYGREHHQEHEYHREHEHHHEHRGLKEVLSIIEKTELTENAKKLAEQMFQALAEAEAVAHGTSVEEVHFHEVGAMDSIVDIVAAAVCLDNLEITEVIVPEVCEGRGTVRCAHGILPIPVPAVSAILEKYQIPVRFLERSGELVTPTGAAILAVLMTSGHISGRYRIERTGLGAGKRAYEQPSILRILWLEPVEECVGYVGRKNNFGQQELIYKLEADMDDCTGEAFGYVMERLLEAGAKDVHYVPIYMKKNRPGVQLDVLCEEQDIVKLEQIIFRETTTIGIRRTRYERTVLSRSIKKIYTKFGEVQVKVCEVGDEKRYYPEYESVAAICREQGVSYQEVYLEAKKGEEGEDHEKKEE